MMRSVNISVSRIPVWVSIVVILGALLLTVGAVVSKVAPLMLTNGSLLTTSTVVYADYTFARNLPLAFMLVFLLMIKARRMLASMMMLIALIQVLDLINDLMRGSLSLVPIVLLFAIVFFVGASKLLGQPVWHVDAWRERTDVA